MARRSIAGPVRHAKAVDKQMRAKAADSFQNFLTGTGMGTDNVLSASTYGFNPITRNRILLEWIHRGSWLGGVAVDVVAEDMTRMGVDLRGELTPEQTEQIEQAATRLNLWPQIADTVRWSRLYGGCIAVMLIDGQKTDTPLRVETVGRGQFKGLLVLDRWQVEPSLNDLVTEPGPYMGLPKYYTVVADAPALPRMRIHYSRCLRLEGIHLPFQQRMMENLWGISVLERLYDRMVAFDSGTTGASQLLYKVYLRTYRIEGLRQIVAAGGQAEQNLIKFVDMMRRFQTNEGITLLDGKDEVGVMAQPSFAGISDTLVQLGQQISGSLQIPLVRLFGQSPVGMNATGESDLRMYYDGIKQQQQKDLNVPVTTMYVVLARSEGIKLPASFALDFRSLWVLSDEQKSGIATADANSVNTTYNSGIISQKTALKELRQSSKLTGRFTNVTDADINAANDTAGASMEAEQHELMLEQGKQSLEHGERSMELEEETATEPQPKTKKTAQDAAARDCDEEAKLTHEEVKYENPAKGVHKCMSCRRFDNGAGSCQIVRDVMPTGWCEEFKARP